MINQPLIEFKNITRRYCNGNIETTVLKSIDLQIYRGEMIAIVGSSGSGKSTLMNILGALDIPDEGEYLFQGRRITDLSNEELAKLRCNHFGFIFQRYHLLPHLSAIENVEIPAIYSLMDKEKRKIQAKNLLCRLGLQKQLEQKPNQLSGGQQQRVSIARALINGCEVILADEPTGALDSQSSNEVLEVLKELHQQGHTIILITHDMQIAKHTERIITLKDGEIISDKKQNPSPKYTRIKQTLVENSTKITFLDILYHYNESLIMALSMMKAHKMRSFLTMLGIIIGIASVVSIIALGEGAKHKVLSEFSSLGASTIGIFPGKNWEESDPAKIQTLTINDLDLLSKQPYILGVSPGLQSFSKMRFLNKTIPVSVNGVSQDFFSLKKYKLLSGRLLNPIDISSNQAVGVIDEISKTAIFGKKTAINNIVFIENVPILIIGIVKSPSLFSDSQTAHIWLPYSAMNSRINNQDYFQRISVHLNKNITPAMAELKITDLLTASHGRKDFFTFNSNKLLQSLNQTTQTLTLMISAIAFISLVVGGIGIMNIMLVSVTERTKEIGIRIAVGAKEKDILQQFLIEAIVVSLIGGIIGVLFSLFIGSIFSLIVEGIKMQFTFSSFVIAFFCSSSIGIIFGYFPAKNAARLKPVDALSRE
ncbi:MacB family efflux pump subunit [Phocoenobacter atlanticus]|uniref:MacB family efflux pump subunit n=1 Tax=Phocoenobacter atlanticus TaxID=3416742 RepID=UPI00276C2519|nr:MacB family efflux pump subunit [Pasteurella atlantica]MDP8100525.1 MacB family efflux pump subunit [Pasteurella atlantica]